MADDIDAPDPAAVRAADLRQGTLSGARWMAMSQATGQAIALVSSIVLAHLIAPSEFGHIAIALVIYSLALAVAQQGIGSALVQLPTLSRRDIEAGVAVSLAAGLILSLATLAFAPLILTPLLGARTVTFIQIMSPAFLIAAPGAICQGLLERKLDFRHLATGDIVAAAIGAGVALTLAILGVKGEAVLLGNLANLAVDSAVLFYFAPLPRPRWHRREIGKVRHFGIPATGSSFAYIATSNIDYVILGSRLGAEATGLYWRAFTLGVDYQSKISSILTRVAFPVLSRAENMDAVRRIRGRIVRVHAVALLPLLGLLVASGPHLVPLLYGAPWASAGTLVQWLALGGMAQVINTGVGPLMLATGHPRALRNYNVVSFCLFFTAVWLSSSHGVDTVVITVAAYRVASLFVCQYVLGQRLIGIPLLDTIKNDVFPAGLSTLCLVLATFGTEKLLLTIGLGVPVVLVISYRVGGVAYVAVLAVAFRPAANDLMGLISSFTPKRLPRLTARRRRVGPAGPDVA